MSKKRYEDDEDIDYLDPDEIDRRNGLIREASQALAGLRIHESITCEQGSAWYALRDAAQACNYYSYKRFTTRKVDVGIYRVWRIR